MQHCAAPRAALSFLNENTKEKCLAPPQLANTGKATLLNCEAVCRPASAFTLIADTFS
jgi:hypothetical protein